MEWSSILCYVVGILAVVMVLSFIRKPSKWIFKLVLNGLLGGVMLLIINHFGKSIGLTLPINPVNSLIAGILGFPGVILIILLEFIL
ncbi:MAG: pro-sigmaK processing inhibitor BofA [Ruminococcaceae bacterium]|nr:pro-sigmaK processing inhibitor BofA [Oscillospiraceae bacterium]